MARVLLSIWLFCLHFLDSRSLHPGADEAGLRCITSPSRITTQNFNPCDTLCYICNTDDQDADLGAQLCSPDEGSPVSSGEERDAFLR